MKRATAKQQLPALLLTHRAKLRVLDTIRKRSPDDPRLPEVQKRIEKAKLKAMRNEVEEAKANHDRMLQEIADAQIARLPE